MEHLGSVSSGLSLAKVNETQNNLFNPSLTGEMKTDAMLCSWEINGEHKRRTYREGFYHVLLSARYQLWHVVPRSTFACLIHIHGSVGKNQSFGELIQFCISWNTLLGH